MVGSLKLAHSHEYVGRWGILSVEQGKFGLLVKCLAVREVYGRFDVKVDANSSANSSGTIGCA